MDVSQYSDLVCNEDQRLRERYVEFNPTKLQLVAAKALGQDRYPNIDKVAEGGFNKVFLLSLDNTQEEVIARIPTPNAGPPRYTTASEVATLNFLRNVLGLPVPKVLAYSATSMNPVGAEYIIMEKVHGESLASRWLSLTTKDVKDIMTQIAEFEQRLFLAQLPGYGSLYHKHDIEGESRLDIPVEGDFCIGPVAKRQFWHGERLHMKIDRGPWNSAKDCLTSAARRELACLAEHAKPQPRRTFLLPTDHNIDPSEQADLLTKFLQLSSLLVPPEQTFHTPTLRHPDLSLSNILLIPGLTKIASIIDWQDTVAFPLFMQAGYPAFCEDDWSQTQSLKIPTLPEEFDGLTPEEKMQAKTKFRLDETNLYYTAATGLYSEEQMKALKIPHLGMRQYLMQQTVYPWDADVINLRAALVGVTTSSIWSSISSQPCPVSFSEEEREKAMNESSEWNESEALLSRIRDNLGIDLEGGTAVDNFEWASQRNLEFRLEFLRQAEDHEREICWRNWPYKDDTDLFSPNID
ncbi:Phosphotransferase enzyme family [Aspergillus sclerotialis]|uniref:Phosphotransferase enzyme family n=1 Tax=Aspergillus sclerotialis TaxID=2070753 RepID=A0A3A2ZD13_9EURO|nr:Phosphotransferase enzyme family [Aspergillus sclerotialis]